MLLDRQKYRFFQNIQLQRCTVKHLSFPVHTRTPKSPGSAPSSTRWLLCSTVSLVLPAKVQPFQLLGLCGCRLHSLTAIAKDTFGGGVAATS
jgi:hypothetical protein